MGVDAKMFVRTKRGHTEKDVRYLAVALHEAFGNSVYVIRPDSMWYPGGRHCAELIDQYEQDGPTLVPEEGEQFIEIQLPGRYYGIGYERGDLPSIIMIAEWLEFVIQDCEVWYGGDSSGVCARPFGKREREDLFAYFVMYGHRPYTNAFDDTPEDNPTCEFCNGQHMIQVGFGNNYAAYLCDGCGKMIETRDSGQTWTDITRD